ncbi:hypothetical protein [Nocardia sp. NPDC003979]
MSQALAPLPASTLGSNGSLGAPPRSARVCAAEYRQAGLPASVRDRVFVLTSNAVIELPSPLKHAATRREWIVAPRYNLRPTTSMVIAAVSENFSKGGPR